MSTKDGRLIQLNEILGANGELISGTNPFPVDQLLSKDMEGLGPQAVGVAAVEVAFTGATTSIIITAHKDNTGVLYVGESDVTNLGANAMTFLEAGEAVTIDYDDSDNAVYVVSDTAAQKYFAGALL